MSEDRARAEVYARSGGRCELGWGEAVHWSHRLPASGLGTYRPSNGLHLSAAAHAWLHSHPALAYAGGWQLRRGDDPRASPVYLLRPYPGWFYIDDVPGDGGPHLVVPCGLDLAEPAPPFSAVSRA